MALGDHELIASTDVTAKASTRNRLARGRHRHNPQNMRSLHPPKELQEPPGEPKTGSARLKVSSPRPRSNQNPAKQHRRLGNSASGMIGGKLGKPCRFF